MKVTQKNIKIRDIFNGYTNNGDDGVFAYGQNLTIRPAYQREFVYKLTQAEAVIQTVLKGFPLNVMYWVKTDEDRYEILDGQQRTLSIMYFLDHQFDIKIDGQSYYWDSLTNDRYNAIMDYELMIYICEGNESEKLDWFRVVNIAGEKLTDQELRNSVYTGPWLTDAKRYFSKKNCAAKAISGNYIKGTPIKQELLEKALKGICEYQHLKDITQYMSAHRQDKDADELWQYFQDVINWIQKIFPVQYPDMNGLDWCHLYNRYSSRSYNSSTMGSETKRLHIDDEVQKTKGIYEYLLSRDTDQYAGRLLSLRAFSTRDKADAYTRQNGLCAVCHKHFELSDMEGDHIIPWSKGGKTVPENCQMLCKEDNLAKSNKY